MPTMELGRLQILVELVDRMSPVLSELGAKVDTVAKNITGMSDDVKRAWADAGKMVGAQVQEFAKTADELVAMSEKTGVGIEALQRLKFAAEQSGTGLNQVVNAIGQMSRRLGGEGGKAVNAALDEIGVSLDKLKNMTPEQAFLTISEALDQMPKSFDRSKAAADLFGNRVGQEIMPMVTGKLRELMDQAPLTSEANVRAMADAGDAYEAAANRIDSSIGNILGTLVEKVGPDTAAIGSMFGDLLTTLAPLTPALVALWPTLVTVGTYIGGALVTAIGAVLSPIGLVVAAVVGLGLAWMKWGEDIKKYVKEAHEAATEWLVEKGKDVREAVRGGLTTMSGYWTDFASDTTDTVKGFMADVKDWFGPKVKAIFEATKAIVNLFFDYHVAMIKAVTSAVTDFLTDIKDWFGAKIRAIFEATKAIVNLFLDYHVAMFTEVGRKVNDFLTNLRTWFGDRLRTIVTGVQAIINPIVTYFTSVKDRVITVAQQLYTGVYNWLVTQFQNIVAGIKGKIDSVIGFFNDMYMKVVGGSIVIEMMDGIAYQFGPRLTSVMVDATRTATDGVVTAFNEMPEKVNFQELVDKWGTALDDIAEGTRGFKETIGGIWDDIRESIGERMDNIKDKFLKVLGDMLSGQTDFKSGLKSIWEEIRDNVIGMVIDQLNEFLANWVEYLKKLLGGGLRPGPPPSPGPGPGGGGGEEPPPEGDRRFPVFGPVMARTPVSYAVGGAPSGSWDSRTLDELRAIRRELSDHQPDVLFVPLKPGETMDSLESRLEDRLPRRIMQSATFRNALQRAINGAA